MKRAVTSLGVADLQGVGSVIVVLDHSRGYILGVVDSGSGLSVHASGSGGGQQSDKGSDGVFKESWSLKLV